MDAFGIRLETALTAFCTIRALVGSVFLSHTGTTQLKIKTMDSSTESNY
jgi:hypothetical protein